LSPFLFPPPEPTAKVLLLMSNLNVSLFLPPQYAPSWGVFFTKSTRLCPLPPRNVLCLIIFDFGRWRPPLSSPPSGLLFHTNVSAPSGALCPLLLFSPGYCSRAEVPFWSPYTFSPFFEESDPSLFSFGPRFPFFSVLPESTYFSPYETGLFPFLFECTFNITR